MSQPIIKFHNTALKFSRYTLRLSNRVPQISKMCPPISILCPKIFELRPIFLKVGKQISVKYGVWVTAPHAPDSYATAFVLIVCCK